MREIKYIVIHCTATAPTARVENILAYWKNSLGWENPGYHYLIDQKGGKHRLLMDDQIGNGVRGYNQVSLHVSYIGGVDEKGNPKDTRTEAQKTAIKEIVSNWKDKYPKAEILGHRDFPNVRKACPSFNVKSEF